MDAFDEMPAFDPATRDTASVDWDMFQVFSVKVRFRRLGFALESADEQPVLIRVRSPRMGRRLGQRPMGYRVIAVSFGRAKCGRQSASRRRQTVKPAYANQKAPIGP